VCTHPLARTQRHIACANKTHMHTEAHAHRGTCTQKCTHTYTNVCACTCTYTRAYMRTHLFTRVCTHLPPPMHAYTKCTHRNAHQHIAIRPRSAHALLSTSKEEKEEGGSALFTLSFKHLISLGTNFCFGIFGVFF
jgi:hypothetical protein